jgi:hypothetical protein
MGQLDSRFSSPGTTDRAAWLRGALGGVVVAASLVWASSALAGVSTKLGVALTPLVPAPTTTTGILVNNQPTEARFGWNVVLTNPTNSNMSGVWFRLTTTTDPVVALPTYITTVIGGVRVDSFCQVDSPAGTAVTCFVGQLAAGGGSSTFDIILKTPGAATKVTPVYTIPNGQGENGQDPGASASVTDTKDAVTVIATQNVKNSQSYLFADEKLIAKDQKKKGNQFIDLGTFTIKVPGPAKASILLEETSESCSFSTCFKTTLNVNDAQNFFDGNGTYLTLTLFRSYLTIPRSASILNLSSFISTQAADENGGFPVTLSECTNNFLTATEPLRCYIPATTANDGPTFIDSQGNWWITVLAKRNLVARW